MFKEISRWTRETADAEILTAQRSLYGYGDHPDIGAYLCYAFKGKSLSETLKRATENELKNLHYLLSKNAQEESFEKIKSEIGLFTFCAEKIADKLTKITGEQWYPFEVKKEELASLPS